MKRKIQANISDMDESLTSRTAQMLTRMNFLTQSCQQPHLNASDNYSFSYQVPQIKKKLQKMQDKQVQIQNPAKKLRSLKTICKTINKFKSANKKSKNVKKLVNKNKVNQLVQLFAQKLTRSVRNKDEEIQSNLIQNDRKNIFDYQGIQLHEGMLMFINFVNVINFLLLIVILTFGLTFHQALEGTAFKYLQVLCAFIGFANICFKLLVSQNQNGKKIEIIKQICIKYLKGTFWIDLVCLLALILNLNIQTSQIRCFRLVFILKFVDFKRNIEQLQYYFINNYYRQQYWGIIHLILTNFFVAHIIAIIFILMARIEPQTNWINNSFKAPIPWYQIYCWSYYWAVTTMLSVGYGDIVAANYKEAICLAFVQTFSCIILAYIINSVGNLIQKLRQKELQKNKNLKIFKQIVQNNSISKKIQENVVNYINQATEIKTKFNYNQQKKLLSELPKQAKSQILKQCNSKLFKRIFVFQHLAQRVIGQLANKIQLTIAHPEQIIFNIKSQSKLLILKEGKVGYYTNYQSLKKPYLMNVLKIQNQQTSRPLHLNFITKQQSPKFTIKSQSYSLIYEIKYETLMSTLSCFPMQNQKFCVFRDKSRHILNQFQVLDYTSCKTKHSKAVCPKIHYIPLKQTTIYKYLEKNKQNKCPRSMVERKRKLFNSYKLFCFIKRLKSEIQYLTLENMSGMAQIILQKVMGMHFVNNTLQKNHQNCELKINEPHLQIRNNQENSSSLNSIPKNRINSFLEVTKKIITNLKVEEQKFKKPYMLLSQLTNMMGIECDSLKDYMNYFPEMNPRRVSIRKQKNSQVNRKISQKKIMNN